MLTKNWESRFLKLQQTLISWGSRYLETLAQRIEVVKVFALSRMYYVASVLPVPKTTISKIEKALGQFIWASSCKVLRIPFNELKLPPERGGLGLTCVSSMSSSLLLTQLLRLLKSDNSRPIEHVCFWIGQMLEDYVSEPFNGIHAKNVPPYFQNLADLVADSIISEVLLPISWKMLSNREVYQSHAKNFSPTKLELDSGESLSHVWQRLASPALNCSTREVLFLFIHNKLPVRERLFRVHVISDPYCDTCFDDFGALLADREHTFCLCSQVSEIWEELRVIIDPLLSEKSSNLELLSLKFVSILYETEVTWLLGAYISEVWKLVQKRGSFRNREEFFGFLKYKFKNDQHGARLKLKSIPNFG